MNEYVVRATLIGYQNSLKRVVISLNLKDVHSNGTTKVKVIPNRVEKSYFGCSNSTVSTVPLD